ncbi:MAG: CDP-glucose 4,6-dehydratase, partial [Acidobacteriota bacterium]
YRRSFFPPDRHAEHGVAVASVRAGNVIGGGDCAADRLVPDIVRAVAEDEAPALRNPRAVRPWQHVLDCLSGYLWLGARMIGDSGPRLAEAWNFGPTTSQPVTVQELAERIVARWGGRAWRPATEVNPPHEAAVLRLDPGKAVERLGWGPAWDLQVSIDRTVDWYRAERDGADMWDVTRRQIHEHQEAAGRARLPWTLPAGRSSP